MVQRAYNVKKLNSALISVIVDHVLNAVVPAPLFNGDPSGSPRIHESQRELYRTIVKTFKWVTDYLFLNWNHAASSLNIRAVIF